MSAQYFMTETIPNESGTDSKKEIPVTKNMRLGYRSDTPYIIQIVIQDSMAILEPNEAIRGRSSTTLKITK